MWGPLLILRDMEAHFDPMGRRDPWPRGPVYYSGTWDLEASRYEKNAWRWLLMLLLLLLLLLLLVVFLCVLFKPLVATLSVAIPVRDLVPPAPCAP